MTFRLADSIPAAAMRAWDEERRQWCAVYGFDPASDYHEILEQLPTELRREYSRLFGQRFHQLLDAGHGECLLGEPWCWQIVEERLRFKNGADYVLGDYVLMPNHVHVLVVPCPGKSVGAITGSWKKHSARLIHGKLGRSGSLWQHESYDHIVRDRKELESLRDYIRENPMKAGGRGIWRASDWGFGTAAVG